MKGGRRPPEPTPTPTWYENLPVITGTFEDGYYLFASVLDVDGDTVKNMLLNITTVDGVMHASMVATLYNNCVYYDEAEEIFKQRTYVHNVNTVIRTIGEMSGNSFTPENRTMVDSLDGLEELVLGKFY